MHECNQQYNLGLDWSEFSVKLRMSEIDRLGEIQEDVAGGSVIADDIDTVSTNSDPEEIEEPNSELMKSAANLRLAELTVAGKMATLRKYLKEHVSEEEFEKVHMLLTNASKEELPEQVSEVIGAEKATVLLPMFQLLCFFEQITAHAKHPGCSPSSLQSFKDIIMDKFRTWDVNGDGVISNEELRKVLCTLGMSEAKVAIVFSSADVNKDGKIDYNEFVGWLCSNS